MSNNTSANAKAKKRYQVLVEAMSQKQDLEGRKSELTSQLSHLYMQRHIIEQDLMTAKNGMHGYQSSEDPTAGGYKDKVDQLQDSLKSLKKTIQATESEVNAIDESFAALNQGASADEIVVHQIVVTEITEKIQQLNGLILEQQRVIESAGVGLIDLSAIRQKKEDLLAEIAQGAATRDDLVPIEAKIEDLEKRLLTQKEEKDKEATEARQIEAGVRRKLAGLETELEHLNQLTPKIIDQFLMKEAEKVSAEYQKQAKQAIASLTRLTALERLITEVGEQSSPIFLTGNQTQTFIPDCIINPVSNAESPGILFKGLYPHSELVLGAIRTEREHFESMGITSL